MTVLYEAYRANMANKDGKKLYYPRVVRVGSVNTATISEEIAQYSSLSPGDVKNALDNLVTVMTQHLQASQSVTLDGLGSFRIVMKSNGKGVETSDKVNAAQATLYVRFLPASTLNPDRTKATRSLLTGAKCKRYDRATSSVSDEEEDPGTGGNSGTGGETGGSGSGSGVEGI